MSTAVERYRAEVSLAFRVSAFLPPHVKKTGSWLGTLIALSLQHPYFPHHQRTPDEENACNDSPPHESPPYRPPE
jgi:hypothetical protein